jgi:hypothetical protein
LSCTHMCVGGERERRGFVDVAGVVMITVEGDTLIDAG